jgi:hypothetical protein
MTLWLKVSVDYIAVWETTARQLTKGEWKFWVASNIHFILAGLAPELLNIHQDTEIKQVNLFYIIFSN